MREYKGFYQSPVTHHLSPFREENMKRLILFLAILLPVVFVSGCKFGGGGSVSGSGAMKAEKREVPAFKALDISGAYDVEIVAQKNQSLEFEGDDNLLPLIKTEVKGGVLRIYNEQSFSTKNKLRVRISMANLDGISTSGASDIVASDVKSDEFHIEASGASNLKLSGDTKSLEVEMSGAGQLEAKDLRAQKVNINISGAARADVYASEELRASVSGAGNVNYYGDPKIVSKEESGAGEISKK
jgi:hypothetical protein